MIYSDLSEEELCLFVLFTDETGLDQAEFCMVDERNKQTGLFRAWPVQQFWWRKKSKKIISQGSRSIGKLSLIHISIIQQVPYDGHFGADTEWSDQVSELNLLNVEAYVPEVMYMYLASTTENREVWNDGLGD